MSELIDLGLPVAQLLRVPRNDGALLANAAQVDGQSAGVLKVGMAASFGTNYLVPLLGEFLAQYPAIIPDWHFGNAPVDMIAGGFDAAIGCGMQVTEGVVAGGMFRTYVVATASPTYVRGSQTPSLPDDLACLDGISRRSSSTGLVPAKRIRRACSR